MKYKCHAHWPNAIVSTSGVTLHCETLAEAQVEDDLTLSCTIKYQVPSTTNCTVKDYRWSNDTDATVICNETNGGKTSQYTCGIDLNNVTLYLHISTVVKSMEGIYKIDIRTDCGVSVFSVNVSVTSHGE